MAQDKRRGTRAEAQDPTEVLIQHVGSRVREIRQDKKLSQTDVASRLRMATPNLQRIEMGRQNVTLSTLARLAEALGVRPLDLLRESRTSTKSGTSRRKSKTGESR